MEFLVELVGSKQQFGIDTLLALHNHEVSFRSLLEPFTPPPEPILIDDSLQDLAQLAESKLLKFSLTAHVLPTEASDLYCLQLQFEGNGSLDFTPDLAVRCYPMTRHDLATTLNAQTEGTIEFKPLTCQALTSFFAFEIWTSDGAQKLSAFLLNVPLEGVPANRRQQILCSLLQDKNQVLKLLLFLLAESKADARELLEAIVSTTVVDDEINHASHSSPPPFPLLEALVRTLDRNPMKLDHIAPLVDDLRQLPPETQLLPDDFESIWQPIYAARQRLNP